MWRPSSRATSTSDGHALSEQRPASTEVPTSTTSLHVTSTRGTDAASTNEVDRRTSVRSILTLPPYQVAPLPSEEVIAREGERAGVDTVVEFPESEAEAEARREGEMEALFHIRQARRREQAEREARRAERRAARERGDWRRLEQLERESRARARERTTSNASGTPPRTTAAAEAHGSGSGGDGSQDSAYLIAELQSLREANRHRRRVSSVSYAEIGLARHDGSRLRADSVESDHRPLLDAAASIGGRSRATSVASTREPSRSRASLVPSRPHTHAASVDQDAEDELPPDPPSYDDDVSIHGGDAPPYLGPDPDIPPVPAVPSAALVAEHQTPSPSPRSSLRQQINFDDDEGAPGSGRPSLSEHEPAKKEPRDAASRPGSFQREPNRPGAEAAAANARIRELRVQTEPAPGVAPAIEVLSATPVSSVPGTPAGGVGFAR